MSGERVERFPGMDVMSQQRHWDEVTRETILDRVAGPERREFFDEHELETAAALIGADRPWTWWGSAELSPAPSGWAGPALYPLLRKA